MSDVGIFGGEHPLRFGTDGHKRIVDALVGRKRSHEQATSALRARWAKDEDQYFGYVPETALDQRREQGKEAGFPEYTTIHVPYNYAMLMAAHTYFTSVLFNRNPVWQVQGRHGETQQQELRWEALLNYQMMAGRHLPSYYVWTHDPLRYGYGVLGMYWAHETVNATRITEVDQDFFGTPIPGKTRKVTVVESVPAYRGNRVYNVHPRDFGWDPRYPIGRFQEGEFCFRQFEIAKLDILQARVPGGKPRFFNLEAIRPMMKGTGGSAGRGGAESHSSRDTRMDVPTQDHTESGYTLEAINLPADEFYVRLNPRVWGLPGPDRIEKWVFLMIDERVIVSAQPLGYMHDRFPFAITEAEVEGYDRAPRSMLHTTKALNETLTWLINSHFYNVRQSLNNKFVVDPSRVVMSDLLGKDGGRIVRLKPEFYGTKVDDFFKQLPVADVTRSNVQDLATVAEMMQRAVGVNDTIMGSVNSGRRTATEVRSSTTLGINRLKTMVEHNSAVAFDPFVGMLIQSTQQMLDFEMELRLVGDLANTSNSVLNIDPAAIAGFYDFVPVDGTLPIDRMAQANMWTQLFSAMTQMPQVLMQYDIGGIFGFVAQLMGIRNINRFKVPQLNVLGPGVAPPGNVVPMPAAARAAGKGEDNSRAPVGPQLPGMGPTQ